MSGKPQPEPPWTERKVEIGSPSPFTPPGIITKPPPLEQPVRPSFPQQARRAELIKRSLSGLLFAPSPIQPEIRVVLRLSNRGVAIAEEQLITLTSVELIKSRSEEHTSELQSR